MAGECLLGIDVGTSRVKAVLFNLNGQEVNSAWRDCRLINNKNHSEMDMNELWTDVVLAIKDVIGKMNGKTVIKAIAVSGQGEGLWLIDRRGEPIGPAMLWNDSRAGTLVSKLEEIPSITKKIRSITGSSLFPGATSVLLRWFNDNHPEQLDKADKLLFCKDWIRYRLTGKIGIDPTDASTSLLDLNSRKSTKELFDLLGIGTRMNLLPPSLDPLKQAGEITNEASAITGLKAGIPVAMGAFDVAATVLGCGAICAGDACVVLGTTGGTIVVSDRFEPDLDMCAGTEIHIVPSQIITISATMSATPNLDWVYNLFYKGRHFEDVEAELEAVPAGCNGLIYHPYISSSGERAPFYCPGAQAQFSGINPKTDPLSMTRAVYEGVALSIKDCLKGQNPKRLFLAGGGARSSFWTKIIANCTGLPVFISEERELCARGSAIMAGITAGVYNDPQDALSRMEMPRRIDPDPELVLVYNEIYEKYNRIRKAMMPVWIG